MTITREARSSSLCPDVTLHRHTKPIGGHISNSIEPVFRGTRSIRLSGSWLGVKFWRVVDNVEEKVPQARKFASAAQHGQLHKAYAPQAGCAKQNLRVAPFGQRSAASLT